MPYNKTVWQDRIVDVTTGAIIQEGTPVSARNLNNIENQLEYLSNPMYSLPKEITANIESLAADVAKGQVNVGLKGESIFQAIKNGNFVNVSEWTPTGATLTATNNTLNMTGNGANSFSVVDQTTTIPYTNGKKIFVRAKVKVTNTACTSVRIRVYGSVTVGTVQEIQQLTPTSGQIYTLSGLITLPSNGSGNTVIGIITNYADAATANGKTTEVQEVMAIDLSSHGLDSLTTDQCNQRFPNWLKYGVNSTLNMRVTSKGKNLFDIKKYTTNASKRIYKIKLTGISNIVISRNIGHVIYIYRYKKDGTYVTEANGWSGLSTSLPIPSDSDYLQIEVDKTLDFSSYQMMIESKSGLPASPYESYVSTEAYYPEIGKSLHNGVKDEVRDSVLVDGKLVPLGYTEKVQRVSNDKTVNGTENWTLYGTTSETNTIAFTIAGHITDSIKDSAKAVVNSDKFSGKSANEVYTTDVEGIAISSSGYLIVKILRSKLTTQDVAGFKTWLASNLVTYTYQLAQEIVTKLDGIDTLIAYPNGTIIIEPVRKREKIYTATGISVDPTYPIKSIESVWKVVGNTYTPVDLSKVTVAADKLSFTITGAVAGEEYRYVYEYPSELTTLPTLRYSYPLNVAAGYDSIIEIQSRLSKELGDVWVTLLPLADKELKMYMITSITTPATATSADVANKINEILNAWK